MDQMFNLSNHWSMVGRVLLLVPTRLASSFGIRSSSLNRCNISVIRQFSSNINRLNMTSESPKEQQPRLPIDSWRKQYSVDPDIRPPYLLESDLPTTNPFQLFDIWFRHVAAFANSALTFEEVNAMALSTVDQHGQPSCRMVLLKAYDDRGFSFYSNYESRKGRELKANPLASLLFYWPLVHRQIRIEGSVEKLPIAMADDYWNSRPLMSRIGSSVSLQSSVIPSRQHLTDKANELAEAAKRDSDNATVPRPEHWGGYILVPKMFEFWQGQTDRLHDRICFRQKVDNTGWYHERLAP